MGNTGVVSRNARAQTSTSSGIVIIEPARRAAVRSARLRLRALTAAAFAGLAIAVSAFAPTGLSGFEADLLRAIGRLPRWLTNSVTTLSQITATYTPFAVIVALLLFRRWRRIVNVVFSFAIATALTDALISRLFNEQPARAGLRQLLENRLTVPSGFPDSGFLAGVVALLVVEGSWLPPRWRRAVRVAVGVVMLTRLISGVVLPRDVLLAVAIGTLIGRIGLLLTGGPSGEPTGADIAEGLVQIGLEPTRVEAADDRPNAPWLAQTARGRVLVRVVNRETRSRIGPARAYRAIRFRNLGEERPFASVEHLAEHQAFASLKAHTEGVSTPSVVEVGRLRDDSELLVFDYRPGRVIADLDDSELTDQHLRGAWVVADQLRSARIAHRRLQPEHLQIDDDAAVFVTDFEWAELGASTDLLANDVAELLISTAARVGPGRAVDALISVLGVNAANDALPRLQPLALTSTTRAAVRGTTIIHDVTEQIRHRTAASEVAPAELERLRPRTLVLIVLGAVAVYLLAPQLAGAGDIWSKVRHANWWWFAAALGASVLTYLGAALSISGSVMKPLPFRDGVVTQVAAAFTGFATPAQLGGMALNTRFLQKNGVGGPVAVAAVGLNAVTAVVVHFLLLVAFTFATGSNGLKRINLPNWSTIAIVLAIVVVVVGVLLLLPIGRRLVVDRAAPFLRQAGSGLVEVGRHPTKLAALVGGALIVTGGYIAALVMAVEALGGGAAVATIGFVFLTASIVASAAPTPGGLGAVEATLVAGLTSAGLASAPALGAVLLYRLATFWLPIAPGVLSFRFLERTNRI